MGNSLGSVQAEAKSAADVLGGLRAEGLDQLGSNVAKAMAELQDNDTKVKSAIVQVRLELEQVYKEARTRSTPSCGPTHKTPS